MNNEKNQYVKTNRGLIPLEDYLDILAASTGYDNYKDMTEYGLSINIDASDIVFI